MSTRRRRRPRMRPKSRPAPRPMQYVERFHLDDAVELAHIRSWADVTVSVQLPPTWLAAGRLPSLAPGDVRDLVPTLYMAEYSPVADLDEYYSDCDPEGDWWCSEAGTLTARGGLIPPVPGNAGLQTYLLDIAGRLFPLNWTNPEPFVSPAIEATGGLYLDPRLDDEGILGPTGHWCRSPWRVTAVRRFPIVNGIASDPVDLERTPDPWDTDEASSVVVDLVAADGNC